MPAVKLLEGHTPSAQFSIPLVEILQLLPPGEVLPSDYWSFSTSGDQLRITRTRPAVITFQAPVQPEPVEPESVPVAPISTPVL